MLMNIAQANAVRVTDGLIGTLQQMNETVMSALVDINSTATRVNQTIGANLYSFSSTFLSLASAVVLSLKQFPLLHLVASTVIRLLWSTLQHIPSFVVMPCAVAVISVLRWILPKILPKRMFGHSRPCVCKSKGSLENKQTLASPVTLGARAPLWARRRPFGWRSSQFSRIPDRLCKPP
ncbi:hypothetical protein BGY98DRAFT_330483 [Russula aff. rugulosa BPL654]|nr:hypothetical protein BGY98DRAFT_330483 [Russula aff. rugulosa BPL654]